jgi:hypothetical protein
MIANSIGAMMDTMTLMISYKHSNQRKGKIYAEKGG